MIHSRESLVHSSEWLVRSRAGTVRSAEWVIRSVERAAMDGGNGGWAYLYGASPITPTTLYLAVDEDQTNDSERRHTTEQVGYVVFESAIVYP